MEPVPEIVRQSALQAFDLRVPDAIVADLAFDPLVETAGTPAMSDVRVLQFRTHDGEGATVEVRPGRSGLHLSVELLPPSAANVELRNPSDSWQLKTSADGRLRIDAVPSGLVSFVIRREGARPIQTSWVRI
jgi:hypothetical protein